jgi:hypothetical protein
MTVKLAGAALIGALALASLATPAGAAEGRNAAAAAGAVGGFALGTLAAQPHYGYPPPPPRAYVYEDEPATCYVSRRRVWDGYGWVMQRRRVCE